MTVQAIAALCYAGTGNTHIYTYDGENRITAVSGADTATFVYDGDGNKVRLRVMVQATRNGVTTTYIGSYFEWEDNHYTKYYYAGSQRFAMRTDQSGSDVLQYILSDHLGSTSTIVDTSGEYVARTGYMPWGDERFSTADIPTDYRYTGQRFEDDLGIYYYNARWYDPSIGRFIQADTIVPDPENPLAYDRYAYVLNNPLRYTDPSGMYSKDEVLEILGVDNWDDAWAMFKKGGQYEGMWGIIDILLHAENGDRLRTTQSNGIDATGKPLTNVTNLGIFNLSSGQLTLSNGQGLQSALGLLSNGSYNHFILDRWNSQIGDYSAFHSGNISGNIQNLVGFEFDSSKFDWFGGGMDVVGVIADIASGGFGGRPINGLQFFVTATKGVNWVDPIAGLHQFTIDQSEENFKALTTDFGGIFVPVIFDIWGLALNFDNAITIYPHSLMKE